MNKKRILKSYIIFLILLIVFSVNVFANNNDEQEEVKEDSAQNFYTDAYKEYLELSDEEKDNRNIIPRKYEVSVDKYLENRSSIVEADDSTTIPARFNLRDNIYIETEDQGFYGLCWGFSSLTSVETYLALNQNEEYDFSEAHLDYLTSNEYKAEMNISTPYSRDLYSGGNFYYFFEDYAILENGPILEFYVPYGRFIESSEYSTLSEYKPDAYVHSVVHFPGIYNKENLTSSDLIIRNDIKRHIMKNGSLYAAITSNGITEGLNGDTVLNETKEYLYDHAVSIIGWDDNYSKENFPENIRPKNDGAYIALNSWGETFGNNGVFYISYEDICVETELSGVTSVTGNSYGTKKVTFKDQELYNTFVHGYPEYIRETDDEELSITFVDVFVNNLNSLEIIGVTDLTGIENFKSLQYISIHISQLKNLDALKDLDYLTGVSLNMSEIEDWTSFKSLDLENFTSVDSNFSDTTLLDNMNSLESIYIYMDAEGISGTLDLSEKNKLESLSIELGKEGLTVKNLKSNILENLILTNVNIDQTEIYDKTNLYFLILENTKVDNLDFITEDFKQLEFITLANTGIKNIDGIANTKAKGEEPIYLYIINDEMIDISKIKDRADINVSFRNMYKTESIDELIFKDEEITIPVPESILYQIEKYYAGEGYELKIVNGTLSQDGKNIVLDTSNVLDNITLQILLKFEGEDDIYYDIKYDIQFDVKDKDTYTEDYARISYTTHVQNIGWQEYVKNGQMSGTSGMGLRLEGIKIKADSNFEGNIEYSTHVENIGWQDYVENDALSGTSGMGLRLEAIKIRLTDKFEENYDVYYRVHAQNVGWLDWAKNGEESGTAGYGFRLEGIEIKLVKKGDEAPGSTDKPFVIKTPTIEYTTHVQNVGWQAYVRDGQMSGTSGKALRLEGIKIRLARQAAEGNIEYSTHVQNIGWQDYVKNDTLSGTSGRFLRLEAIKIRLTDELAEKFDVYYRVHAENAGWLGWAKNGEASGTAGYGFRLEGIEIKLLPKDENFTGNRENHFLEKGN